MTRWLGSLNIESSYGKQNAQCSKPDRASMYFPITSPVLGGHDIPTENMRGAGGLNPHQRYPLYYWANDVTHIA